MSASRNSASVSLCKGKCVIISSHHTVYHANNEEPLLHSFTTQVVNP